ncbi:hypothetical protein [Kluyvera ascorbata]|uniref:hypothetical protein n=1 Tax=Kluyvera ascorbata TaxID=51288 RepID=UPI0034D7A4D7
MKKTVLVVFLFLNFNVIAAPDSLSEIINSLKEPYAVTQLEFAPVQCVWTRNEYGKLQNENSALEGTGLCWDIKAIRQAEALEQNGKLKWVNQAQKNNAQLYTDIHNACFYGYMGNATSDWELYLANKYGRLIGEYKNQVAALEKFKQAFDFGKNIAKQPSDCRSITDDLFTH